MNDQADTDATLSVAMGAGKRLRSIRARGTPGYRGTASADAEERSATSTRPGRTRRLFSTRTIDGTDDRRPVGRPGAYPFRVIFRITMRMNGVQKGGTAFLVGNRTLLTAGHCLYEGGINADGLRIFGPTGAEYTLRGACSLSGWVRDQDDAFDLACIQLRENVGPSLGFFGTRVIGGAKILGTYAIAGFPLDRDDGRTLYIDAGNVKEQGALLNYSIDTERGQSGSPLFFLDQGKAFVVGVHIQGASTENRYNKALRFRPDVMKQIKTWISEGDGA